MRIAIMAIALLSAAAPVHPTVTIVPTPEGPSVEARCPKSGQHTVDVAHKLKPNMTTPEAFDAFRSMVCVQDDPPAHLDPRHESKHQ